MSNSVTNLDLISQSQSQKEVTANALFDAASPALLYGRHASATGGLTWGYYGGNLSIGGVATPIANGIVALLEGTNCIEADPATGAVTRSGTFTTGKIKLYTVVVTNSLVSSYTDHRTAAIGVPSGASQPIIVTLTYAATLTVNLSAGDIFELALSGPCAMSFSGGYDGKVVKLRITQGGAYALTLSGVRQGTDFPAYTANQVFGKKDVIAIEKCGTYYDLLSYSRGY